MERFLYDFSLFKWAWTGPIYWGNFLTFVGGFFLLLLIGWAFEKEINPFKIILFSILNVLRYILKLFMVQIINNFNIRNKLVFLLVPLLLISNPDIKFLFFFIVSNIIIWQILLYYEKEYFYEYRYGKKLYFILYSITLFTILWIIKYNLFITIIPYIIIAFHIILCFKLKK